MPIQSTRLLFETLFAKTDRKTEERLLAHKKSVLDGSLEEAKALMTRVSGRDRERLAARRQLHAPEGAGDFRRS